MRLLRKSGDVPKRSLWQRIKDIAAMDVAVLARGGVAPGSLEDLEQLLLEADFGVPVTLRLVEAALLAGNSEARLASAGAPPTVILIVGVNGAGKTTFIGKLSDRFRREGKRVMVAAGDTFRAGAIDQLRLWAERTGAVFVGAKAGADPAAVAFDAIDAATTRGVDVLIVDTAGRLHTSEGLMEELRKVARVIAKRLPGAPHETLLVLDGTIGQNAVQQAKTFSAAVPVTGLV